MLRKLSLAAIFFLAAPLFVGRPRCALLLLFLLPGLTCHFFLLSRLVIVEFRHELSVAVSKGDP